MFFVNSIAKLFSASLRQLFRYLLGLIHALRHCSHVNLGLSISPKSRLETGVHSLGKSHIGSNVKIGRGTYINSGIIDNAEIGRYCSISYNVTIGLREHNIGAESTSPVYAKEAYGNSELANIEVKRTIIEDHVWIGAGAIILQGKKIGKHSVIGAGAVVTKDVPQREIWVGVPAKKIGIR